MNLLIQSAMIFFGTLLAAAGVALGAPAKAEIAIATSATPHASSQRAHEDARNSATAIGIASNKGGFSLR